MLNTLPSWCSWKNLKSFKLLGLFTGVQEAGTHLRPSSVSPVPSGTGHAHVLTFSVFIISEMKGRKDPLVSCYTCFFPCCGHSPASSWFFSLWGKWVILNFCFHVYHWLSFAILITLFALRETVWYLAKRKIISVPLSHYISPLNVMYAIRDKQGCNNRYKWVHQELIAFPIVTKDSLLLHVGATLKIIWGLLSYFCLQCLIWWNNWIQDSPPPPPICSW